MKINELGEFGLIDKLVSKLPPVSKRTLVGVGDDAAVFRPTPDHDLVLSTDMLVQDVHFAKQTMSFQDVGWKSLAASISDIAAMGAVPRQALVSVAVPRALEVHELEAIYEGIADIARVYQVDVVGGDTVKTADKLVLSVTLTGEVPAGRSLLRSGAKPGDCVFLSGPVGGSAAGLHSLTTTPITQGKHSYDEVVLHQFHRRPQPQVAAGSWLMLCGGCHALNDVSDGVASEANEIAYASCVTIELTARAIPIAPEVRRYAAASGLDALEWALYGGEDYQLIGCLDAKLWPAAAEAFVSQGLSLHLIGSVAAAGGAQVLLVSEGQRELLLPRGYNHFGS
ncbi:MAG: thiamine-phosphate kinase [Bacilli bacterium]|nr:thiamine-phosphate kinase [Bacilli bacterium]